MADLQVAINGDGGSETGQINQVQRLAAEPENSTGLYGKAPSSLEDKSDLRLWPTWIQRYSEVIPIYVALLGLMIFLYLWPRHSVPNVEFTRLTTSQGEEAYPSLSPDGKSLLYASADGKVAIYLLRIGSNKPIKLTSESAADSWQPTYSPNGDLIAFSSGPPQGGAQGDSAGIFVMGATGENVKRLTEFGACPAWSPDQKQIVFTTGAIWSPDGTRLAYTGRDGGGTFIVEMSEAAGG